MTWRILALAATLALLAGCDPEQAATADGILGWLEANANTAAAAGVPGMVLLGWLVKIGRTASRAAHAVEGPSRASGEVAALRAELAAEREARVALERDVERLELLLLARGIGTVPVEPMRPAPAGAVP